MIEKYLKIFFLAASFFCSPMHHLRRIKSPIHIATLGGRAWHIKRDDLMPLSYLGISADESLASYICGNKVRKFAFLANMHPFPPSIASYGGPQSNSMVALAALAAHFASPFYYFTPAIPALLRTSPIGNYKAAVDLGMKVIEIERTATILQQAFTDNDAVEIKSHMQRLSLDDVYWIPQGGACMEASVGLQDLATEIAEYAEDTAPHAPWQVYIESGTGATALFVHQYLKQASAHLHIAVIAVPCIGTAEYLLEQMRRIDNESFKVGSFPEVLTAPSNQPQRVFGKPYKELAVIWNQLCTETGIEFDLLYAPRAFEQIFEHLAVVEPSSRVNLMYVHCGGQTGNASQKKRYEYKKLDI